MQRCTASYQAEPEGLLVDMEGVLSSSGGGREHLELVRDKGEGATLGGTALGVTGSVILAYSNGRPAGRQDV